MPSGNLPLKPGYTQSEPVSRAIYDLCQAAINPTTAQVAAMAADQRKELLSVEDWCNAFAIRTNPVPVHSG